MIQQAGGHLLQAGDMLFEYQPLTGANPKFSIRTFLEFGTALRVPDLTVSAVKQISSVLDRHNITIDKASAGDPGTPVTMSELSNQSYPDSDDNDDGHYFDIDP